MHIASDLLELKSFEKCVEVENDEAKIAPFDEIEMISSILTSLMAICRSVGLTNATGEFSSRSLTLDLTVTLI